MLPQCDLQKKLLCALIAYINMNQIYASMKKNCDSGETESRSETIFFALSNHKMRFDFITVKADSWYKLEMIIKGNASPQSASLDLQKKKKESVPFLSAHKVRSMSKMRERISSLGANNTFHRNKICVTFCCGRSEVHVRFMSLRDSKKLITPLSQELFKF